MSSTVILGTGIIGVSAAYYLSKHQPGSTIHLVESAPELFSSASGHAGGFLARDWFQPTVAALGALSFEEHRRLAKEHGGRDKWAYSPSTSIGYSAVAADKGVKKRGDDWLRAGTSRANAAPASGSKKGTLPGWLKRVPGDDIEVISEEGAAAQLDPLPFCMFLLKESMARGVRLHHPARAVSVKTDEATGQVSGARVVKSSTKEVIEIPCTRIIITAGAWSPEVFRTLFQRSSLKLPVTSLAGHSIIVKSPRWRGGEQDKDCHAVYTSHDAFCPEIFARVDGNIYFAGLNSAVIPLPSGPEGAKVIPAEMAKVKGAARELLGDKKGEDDLQVVKEALCFRPVTSWGTPIVGRIPDEQLGAGVSTRPGAEGGVYLATGHGPWGISMSVGTGVVLAELVQGRPLSADISALGFDEKVIRAKL